MQLSLISLALAAAATVSAGPLGDVRELINRQTGTCDALACARTVVADVGVGAFCMLVAASGNGNSAGALCSVAEKTAQGNACQACEVKKGCDPDDEKAKGKACGPGNLAQLGMCIDPYHPNIDHPSDTDVIDGDYIVHCANQPQVPSGVTTDGGQCIYDCSQCQQCVSHGKNQQVIRHS